MELQRHGGGGSQTAVQVEACERSGHCKRDKFPDCEGAKKGLEGQRKGVCV